MKKTISLLLAFVLCVSLFIFTATAAELKALDEVTIVNAYNTSMTIKLTKVANQAISSKFSKDQKDDSYTMFLWDDSTITFSKDLVVKAGLSGAAYETFETVLVFTGGTSYTYKVYKDLYSKARSDFYKKNGVDNCTTSVACNISFSDASTFAASWDNIRGYTYSSYIVNTSEISVAGKPSVNDAPLPENLADITVALPGIPNLQITLKNAPDLCGEIGFFGGLGHQIKFYFDKDTTISFNKDINIGGVNFKSGTPIKASTYPSGTLTTFIYFSTDGKWRNTNDININITGGEQLYLLAFIDVKHYLENIIEDYSFTNITKWRVTSAQTSPEADNKDLISKIELAIPDCENIRIDFTSIGKKYIYEDFPAKLDTIPNYFFAFTSETRFSINHDLYIYDWNEGGITVIITRPIKEDDFFFYGQVGEKLSAGVSYKFDAFSIYKAAVIFVADYNGEIKAAISGVPIDEFESLYKKMLTNPGDSKTLQILSMDYLDTSSNSPLYKADSWAKLELTMGFEAKIIPASIAKGGWKSATSRLAAADAMIALIESVTGKTINQIATEKGWDLSKNTFNDTSAKSVTFLKYAGVTNGIGDNKYDPNGTYTRAQEVTMIGRVAEHILEKTVKGANPFTDVPDWAAPYVGYAADNGITNGIGGGKFDPDGVLQNQHTAVFSYRAFVVWL